MKITKNLQFRSTVTVAVDGNDILLFDAWQVNTAIKSCLRNDCIINWLRINWLLFVVVICSYVSSNNTDSRHHVNDGCGFPPSTSQINVKWSPSVYGPINDGNDSPFVSIIWGFSGGTKKDKKRKLKIK